MLVNLLSLFVVAIVIEGTVKAIFSVKVIKDFDARTLHVPLKMLLAIVTSIYATIHYDIDIFNLLLNKDASIFGLICTGVLVSRGSNYLHILVKQIDGVRV